MDTTDTPTETALEDGLRLAARLREQMPMSYVARSGNHVQTTITTMAGATATVMGWSHYDGPAVDLHVTKGAEVNARHYPAGAGSFVCLGFGRDGGGVRGDSVYLSPEQARDLLVALLGAVVGLNVTINAAVSA